MSCNIIPECPIPLPVGIPSCCTNTMIIEYRNYAGCDLITNTIVPINNSFGWECSGSSACVSTEVVNITSCITINRVTIDMDCLQTTAPTGTILLNACWFSTVSPSAFSITVTWQQDTQIIYNSTDDQAYECCANPVALISYADRSFYLQTVQELFEIITNPFDNAIVTDQTPYPNQDTENIISPNFSTPFVLIPPGLNSISGNMPNAIVTALSAYPQSDSDVIITIQTDTPNIYITPGLSSISGDMPSAIVSYNTTYPTPDTDISINNLITSPPSGVYL